MMNLLKKIPFFLFLLVVFFCLHGSVENYGYLYMNEVLEVGAISLVCIAVVLLLTWLLSRNFLFASLLVFFISLWYLFFGAVHDLIKANSFLNFLQSYTVLLPVLLIVNVLVIWWLKKNRHLYPKLFLYLNLLFIIFCISDGILLAVKHGKYKEPVANAVGFKQQAVTKKPNVYFLLFDEYAGYKSLQDSFGFKNDSLYNFMQQQQGFKILPTFSNYDFTPYSMSSIFNMQYIAGSYNNQVLTQADIQQRFGEVRNAAVPAIFKTMGYSITNLSMFDFKDDPALSQSNGLFPIHAALLTNKIFHKRLMKDIGWWFVTGPLRVNALKQKLVYKDDDYNKLVEEKLLQSIKPNSQQPQFCYAHFFLPHSQYCRDSTGALNTPEKVSDLYNKPLYLSYLKYTNGVMQGLVKKITSTDTAAIVIVMSDHGFYDYNSPGDYDPYNYDNICMVRLPAASQDSINLPRSNVNVFKYLFNTGFGQSLPYVKDSAVYVIEAKAVK